MESVRLPLVKGGQGHSAQSLKDGALFFGLSLAVCGLWVAVVFLTKGH